MANTKLKNGNFCLQAWSVFIDLDVCIFMACCVVSFQAVVIDEDGSQVIRFPNGTKKVINTDGSVSMYFFNGDSKQIKPDNTVVYLVTYLY